MVVSPIPSTIVIDKEHENFSPSSNNNLMSCLPNSNIVAVRASQFSETSPQRNQDYGRSTSANYYPNVHNNVFCRSPDVERPTGRPSSNYEASREHIPRVQTFRSGMHEHEKRDRPNKNNDFQHRDPSVLDRFNYTPNK